MNARKITTASSVILNVALLGTVVAIVINRGGWSYVTEKMGWSQPAVSYVAKQQEAIALHNSVPDTENEIVFFGDSITASMAWHEFYSDIRNRGLSGDSTAGALTRLPDVLKCHPQQLFINIGTNDLASGASPQQVVANVAAMVGLSKRESPNTGLILCSILPINVDSATKAGLAKARGYREGAIAEANELLRVLANSEGCAFVDLHQQFVDEQGRLSAELTTDGIHLSAKGIVVYCETLRPLVKAELKDSGA